MGALPMDQIHGTTIAAQSIAARLDRLPVSSWHIRVRLILGIDAMDLLAISFAVPAIAGPGIYRRNKSA